MNEIVDFLQTVPELHDVPREQLEWVVRESRIVTYDVGIAIRAGEATDELLILLEGKIQAYSTQNNQRKVLMTVGPGALTGLLPFSRMKTSPVFLEVLSPIKAMGLHKSKFREMICANFELTEVFVHALSDRVRLFTSLHFQDEKLMALGKLSAGLAHELNNPAAAILRGAEELKQTMGDLQINLKTIASIELTSVELTALEQFLGRANYTLATRLPLLERKQREDDLLEWLEEYEVGDCAESFVEFGFTMDDLDRIRGSISESTLRPLLGWLSQSLQARNIAEEIGTSSRRISELVQSVKSYTRMDQVHDMQEVAIDEGIRNTLTMLQYKIRHNSITVRDDFAAELPAILGFPGELNQVWTNIIDNALDAMKAGGELTVQTLSDREHVFFVVTDTGPGIPKENLERIFDPFFTTKDVGEGTGVGLDLVRKIVQQHHGRVDVNSRPGHTEFKISFPRITVA